MAKKKAAKNKAATRPIKKKTAAGQSPARKTAGKESKQAWGLCQDCKWWQIEPRAEIAATTLGLCIDEQLQPFRLSVSGASGCNRFMPGEPARAKGSGAQPPKAEPTR